MMNLLKELDKAYPVAVRLVGGKASDWSNDILLLYDWTLDVDYLRRPSSEADK